MDLLFAKILICCSVVAFVWVRVLTVNRQIFDFIPKYYPKILLKPLTCDMCLSGWLSIIFVFSIFVYNYGAYNHWIYVYTFLAPFFTMCLTLFINNNIKF
jgi:hypothetical protein